MKRGFSDAPPSAVDADIAKAERRKKRKSRWGDDIHNKTYIPGMPTVIPKGMNKSQEEQYLVQLQIEELSTRIRAGNLGIPDNPDDRSPSPEPIYSSDGKRMNTREYRKRKEIEDQRHALVLKATASNPDYRPPSDYKAPTIKVSDKVIIPQEQHPDINFVGLLIGPRGNTLKNLERETMAKIIIRGKGSVKEGKIGRKDGMPMPGEDEPLHAYITATDPAHVTHAVTKINDIIKEGINVPEGENDLRKQQLRELALLNGTLRETDCLSKLKNFQESQNIVTNTIICSICGGAGHLAQDCKDKRPGESIMSLINMPLPADKAKLDHEYLSLMAELGEGPAPGAAPAGKPFNRPTMSQNIGGHQFALEAPPLQQFNKPPSLMSLNLKQPIGLTTRLPFANGMNMNSNTTSSSSSNGQQSSCATAGGLLSSHRMPMAPKPLITPTGLMGVKPAANSTSLLGSGGTAGAPSMRPTGYGSGSLAHQRLPSPQSPSVQKSAVPSHLQQAPPPAPPSHQPPPGPPAVPSPHSVPPNQQHNVYRPQWQPPSSQMPGANAPSSGAPMGGNWGSPVPQRPPPQWMAQQEWSANANKPPPPPPSGKLVPPPPPPPSNQMHQCQQGQQHQQMSHQMMQVPPPPPPQQSQHGYQGWSAPPPPPPPSQQVQNSSYQMPQYMMSPPPPPPC